MRILERSEDYGRLFRYRSVFEESAAWTEEAEAAYAALCDGVARVYSLPPFDHAAVGALIEEGARRTSIYSRSRVITDLALLRDLSVEAGRYAQERGESPAGGSATLAGVTTTAADVDAVLARRRDTYSRPALESREDILTGRAVVPTAGSVVGQVNGLTVVTVYPPGPDSRFGVPFRLTVTVTPGRERLVDVEREADHADRSHVAGALTMAGYLAWRYGHDRPIHAVARLRFEQGGSTAGPSASAAELFALLSALAGVPIHSCVAVTGAVGQHGEVQVIGGVSDKIEGFWQICRTRRELGEIPSSTYGILIPAANMGDLMLRPEVAQVIAAEGWFHVWPIATVDEGIPLLTGLSASAIHERVDATLARYYELARSDPAARR
jgi:predicted ATP-dependent protease